MIITNNKISSNIYIYIQSARCEYFWECKYKMRMFQQREIAFTHMVLLMIRK